MDHPPGRTLRLSTPLARGEDVRRLQVAVNARHRSGKAVTVDGQYGPQTAHAAKVCALALGCATSTVKDGLSPHAQRIIRSPKSRNPVELYRAKQRAKNAAKRQQGAQGAIKVGLEIADRSPHVTESPAGSNRGPLIDIMQKAVGMIGQPWCGAFVFWCLKNAGIEVTPEVRYCPATEAHAKNGTGGFRDWVPAHGGSFAPAGSLVLYGQAEAQHVGLLVKDWRGEPSVSTVEGNTSSGPHGSQDNGGGVFRRQRPIDGPFPVRGFAIPRGVR